ncbi:signal transduction histidine kinase [Flavobacterium limnosediminis JC2902]|uniref:histidine kinase n=2 Tax=Flavobacterium TaxID=237 RepID=V6SQI0_9FLAO|nr:signal transduction histidine kinase [Flavobacterium limnosediminis JC2902]
MLFFAFGLIFLVLFYQNYFIKMKRKEAELLLKASLDSEKQERQRIASDLHDGVSGDLNAIRNYLSVLQKSEKDLDKQELFAEIKESVEAALENTRQVSYKLMPPLLELAGFTVALQDYFERLSKNSTMQFEVVCKDPVPDFSPETSYELFRVVQEFTTNMIKYGSVSHCCVVLYSLETSNFIEIIDDGVSYDFKSLSASSKGSGIKNINSRLKVLGAALLQRDVSEGNHFVITLKK